MKTTARFLENLKKQFLEDDKKTQIEGDRFITVDSKPVIIRFKNGYIDGGEHPAIEGPGNHIEYWKQGMLHRKENPAIIAENNIIEYWENGEQIKIEHLGGNHG